jgi:hypothetical protein
MNDLFKILDVVDKAYGEMVDLMGPAKADLWGDDAIDVYAVPPGAGPPREKGDYAFEDDEAGVTDPPASPDRRPLGQRLRDDAIVDLRALHYQMYLIHELFHVLQNAHNYLLRNCSSKHRRSGPRRISIASRPSCQRTIPGRPRTGSVPFRRAVKDCGAGRRPRVRGVRVATVHGARAQRWRDREAWNLFESVGASAEQADIQLSTVLPFAENFHPVRHAEHERSARAGKRSPGPLSRSRWGRSRGLPVAGTTRGSVWVTVRSCCGLRRRARRPVLPHHRPGGRQRRSVDFRLQRPGGSRARERRRVHSQPGRLGAALRSSRRREANAGSVFDRGPSTEMVRGSFDEVRSSSRTTTSISGRRHRWWRGL